MPKARWYIAGSCVMALAAAGVTAAAVSGSGSSSRTRALTSDEANRLAITRFRNYEAGGRAVTITVPGTAGDLVLTGSIDYRAKLGYGVVHGTGRDTSSDGLIEWTASSVLVDPMPSTPAAAPATPPTTGWFSRPLQQTGSSLDSALAITLNLGSDRPDNAQLLPQNGAMWVGHDQVAGRQTDIMTGPAARDTAETTGTAATTAGTVRYWIGADGTMYRVQAALASESQPAVIDFDTQKYSAVPPTPAAAQG
ncbi:hypothetical protein ABIA31_001664 [Catenulispora sp. MAP5-51]|uniref:hypothetical protein n=1 Tax=Catenulispora sp. MAP5-51 TaxID=3156298 RepID=UPI003516D3F8